jgi:regulator of protease activity HflC (stomatin/prohibitin superfamily)
MSASGAGEPAPTRGAATRDVLAESLMLTGDENIVDIDFAVFWRIRDAGEFLFNTRNPEETVKSAAESVMREIIGRTQIQQALTEARAQIEQDVRRGTQAVMDQYRAGWRSPRCRCRRWIRRAPSSMPSVTCSAPMPTASAFATRRKASATT